MSELPYWYPLRVAGDDRLHVIYGADRAFARAISPKAAALIVRVMNEAAEPDADDRSAA
jgi:hypothetical protein